MKCFYRVLAASLIVFFITACGGGSSTVATTETTTETVKSFKAPENTQPIQQVTDNEKN